MKPMEPKVEQIRVEIIAGCSDARDVSDAFNNAKDARVAAERKEGILVDIQRLSIPGVFATGEVIAEVKTLIFDKAKQLYSYSIQGVPVDYYVHMMAHGNAALKPGRTHETMSYQDIEIKEAAFNCGMMNAKKLALEFEALLLSEKPNLTFGLNSKSQRIQVATEADLERLMQKAHNHNGTPAGNWVKSIENLATHPYEQKKIMRAVMDADPALKHLQVHITAGVQNYATNEYYRVDGNTSLRSTIDLIYQDMRKAGVSHDQEHRVAKQKPELLLFHHSSIHNARATAVERVFGDKKYGAGQVFAIGGANAGDHIRLFGPYKTIGFYYGGHSEHLGLQTWAVMGRGRDETERMCTRLHNDPLVGFIIRHFGIKLEKIAVDPRQSFPHINKSTGTGHNITGKQTNKS
ncbi:Uncharacterised protein [uncultured archaeon]|nr:Uncharacterised protein [uncultured archaeon]